MSLSVNRRTALPYFGAVSSWQASEDFPAHMTHVLNTHLVENAQFGWELPSVSKQAFLKDLFFKQAL